MSPIQAFTSSNVGRKRSIEESSVLFINCIVPATPTDESKDVPVAMFAVGDFFEFKDDLKESVKAEQVVNGAKWRFPEYAAITTFAFSYWRTTLPLMGALLLKMLYMLTCYITIYKIKYYYVCAYPLSLDPGSKRLTLCTYYTLLNLGQQVASTQIYKNNTCEALKKAAHFYLFLVLSLFV